MRRKPVALARRLDHIQPFRVMQVLDRAANLERAGHNVVHFEVGEPDFATAAPIVTAGCEALQAGRTRYTSATGIPELRAAIAAHYAAMGLDVDADRIVITAGASGGLSLLTGLLLDPGEGLLITDPGYPCNEVFVHQVGAVPQTLPVQAVSGFQPTVEELEQYWQSSTRGALLASPANPTGTMLSRARLLALSEAVRNRDGFLILDEIYQGLVTAAEYPSGLAVDDDICVLNSFSKFFGMTGWRLGWIVVPPSHVDAATRLAQNLFICPSAPAQYAALAAFSPEAMTVHYERAAIFARRGKLLADGLTELGFHIPVLPDGAFYLYVDVSHTGLASDEFCVRLLDEYHVAATPGHDFGSQAPERFVRFAFTTSEEAIREGLMRIGRALVDWGIVGVAGA